MPTLHSLRASDIDPLRIVRHAILNGVPIPAVQAAQLEARGINVGDLENRLRQNLEFAR
jgi:hypothetical protein